MLPALVKSFALLNLFAHYTIIYFAHVTVHVTSDCIKVQREGASMHAVGYMCYELEEVS